MLFSSVTFLFMFLPLVLLLYFISPRKLKNIILLVFSLVFYAWGEPIYVVLMIISTLADYCFGLFAYEQNKKGNFNTAKWAIVGTVVFNIGMLVFFKYTDFFIQNINHIFGMNLAMLNLPLPIGISFYSFQTMSYTIDVYRGDAKPQKNPLDLATYVTLFPQLIAGPIVRYQTVADQLNDRKETLYGFSEGVRRFVIGLGKKVLLANPMGELFKELNGLALSNQSVALSWMAIIAFTFQIYFDFSGYSDMAIGLGKIFGFDFLENFNYPYISRSISEFWRRWHISLSTWFRDYIYIPLGGSRCSKFKAYRNIIIVWFLTGFWHGANWNYIFWGLYFCFILIIEKAFLLKILTKLPGWFQHLYALILILVSWVLFAYEDTAALLNHIRSMFALNKLPLWNQETTYYLLTYGVLFLVLSIGSTPLPAKLFKHLQTKLTSKSLTLYENILVPLFLLGVLILTTAYLVSNSFNPFLYFRF